MFNWSDFLFDYYRSLKPPKNLPNGVEWLFPHQREDVLQVLQQFLQKFYNDHRERTLLMGINPGRYGAGITGINFTAPNQLKRFCGIDHPFNEGTELSAEFIYEMIDKYGGPSNFYNDFFISSVCPLGLVKGGKNINYYDDKELLNVLEPFIIKSIKSLLVGNFKKEKCYSIGGEKNFKYLASLNEKYKWFDNIIPLPHPRFIMQYKRKQKEDYLDMYMNCLRKMIS